MIGQDQRKKDDMLCASIGDQLCEINIVKDVI